METKYILMILFFVQLFFLFYFREKDIRKNTSILDSDKEIMMSYFQKNFFVLLSLSFFIVFIPYTLEIDNDDYIILYIVLMVLFFIFSIYLHKKYLRLSEREKTILAVQKSNFDMVTVSKYSGKKFLNEIEKKMIKANNHFKFTVKANDLTIQNIKLDKNYINFEFKEFCRELGSIELNPKDDLMYKKLIIYINKKLKYNNLDTIKIQNREYKLILLQTEIFNKVQELNNLNITLKIGQLFTISKNTFDMQFLSFIDALKIKNIIMIALCMLYYI